eukprot:scaffold30102_cov21-Tisochrysis_lutea.AAC.2
MDSGQQCCQQRGNECPVCSACDHQCVIPGPIFWDHVTGFVKVYRKNQGEKETLACLQKQVKFAPLVSLQNAAKAGWDNQQVGMVAGMDLVV